MHPYENLPQAQYWSRAVSGRSPDSIALDPAPKLRFDLATERFATAGSCFAQHFGRALLARGGQLVFAEQRHPLMEEDAAHGCGVFSARYGNIYTTLQLRDLLEQALGQREPVCEFARRPDGRWIDLLRPRSVPEGFSSLAECRADRIYHLGRVRELIGQCSTFVFTLGLTETWVHARDGHAYALCPGVAGGEFDPALHRFRNLSYEECLTDLNAAIALLVGENPAIKVLLTVSPVLLVATQEPRGVVQSSVASKAILRAVADACARAHAIVDYFPSFEIIAGPQSRGCFYDVTGREVTAEGVRLVMDTFFATRVVGQPAGSAMPAAMPAAMPSWNAAMDQAAQLVDAECDEILLDAQRSARG